jgi:hypothetical protein
MAAANRETEVATEPPTQCPKVHFEKVGLKIEMVCGSHVLSNGNVVFSSVAHGAKPEEFEVLR